MGSFYLTFPENVHWKRGLRGSKRNTLPRPPPQPIRPDTIMRFPATCAVLAAAAVAACASTPPAGANANGKTKTNVIFILSDDLGYGDIEIANEMLPGATRIPTPNIERMARNGMKFHRGSVPLSPPQPFPYVS